jgi:hypothetical protein
MRTQVALRLSVKFLTLDWVMFCGDWLHKWWFNCGHASCMWWFEWGRIGTVCCGNVRIELAAVKDSGL